MKPRFRQFQGAKEQPLVYRTAPGSQADIVYQRHEVACQTLTEQAIRENLILY